MNVDDVVRELRHSVRGPADGLVDQIVAAAPSTGRGSSRRRVNGRALLVAATVSVALVVVLALAVVLRGGGRTDPVPATPVIPPARVDWGMVATVKLTPDPGVSIQEMRERFATALAFRTDDEGGAGIDVVSDHGDEVTVRLPGAETRNQVDDYLRFLRMVIVDDEESVIATASDIGALPEVPGKPGEPRDYFVQEQEKDGTWSAPLMLTSREDAEKWRAQRASRGAALSVPAGVSVVGGGDGAPVTLMRRTPLVPSSAIRGVRFDGDVAVVLIDPKQRLGDDRRVSVFAGTATTGEPDLGTERIGTGTLTSDGRLRLPLRQWSLIPSVARPDLGGTIEVRTVSTYGVKPAERLDRYRASGTAGPMASSIPEGSHWVRLTEGKFDGREQLLLGAEYRGVLVATAFHDESQPGYPNGGGQAVGTKNRGPLRSVCPVGIGTPMVVRCGGSGGDDHVKNGQFRLLYADLGRVRPGVARVAVRIRDRYYDAVIKNGWWMIVVDDTFPSVDDSPQGFGNMEIFNSATVLAWDAGGHPIPVSPRTIIRS